MYQGIVCLLHFDDNGFIDSGPSSRPTSVFGYAEFDGLNGVYSPTGCMQLPSFPGNTAHDGGCGVRIPLQNRELELQNDSLTVEMSINPISAIGFQRLAEYGGSNSFLGFELSIDFRSATQELNFTWRDRFDDIRRILLPMPSNPVTAGSWNRLVWQYDKSTNYISAWVDGTLAGTAYGPSTETLTQRPWDGLWIRNMAGASAPNITIGSQSGNLGIGTSATSFAENFRGKIDEVRITGTYAFYDPLAATIPVPIDQFEDPEPDPEPEPIENVSINRPMINGVGKTNIKEFRFTAAFCSMTSEPPSLDPRVATHEGKLYFHQPDPDYPKVFVYVLYNIQGEGESEVLKWIPVSGPEVGKVNMTTGTSWKSRKNPRLGEPF